MSDPESTIPPRQPRTIRTLLRWLVKWAQEHQVAAAILGGLATGFLLGKVL